MPLEATPTAHTHQSRVRLLVTSIVRHIRQEQKSGFARVVELPSGRVLMKSPVPESAYRGIDPNPRGGLRGARGVAVCRDRILIANAERVLVFDRSWARVGELSHPLTGGIHDILAEDDGVWVTSTNADLLVKLDWDGRVLADWEWRRDDQLVRSLGFGGLPWVDRTLDYRDPETMRNGVRNVAHLNSVGRGPDGLLVSLGRVLSAGAYRKARLGGVVGRAAKAVGLRRSPRRAPASGTPGPPVSLIEGSAAAVVLARAAGPSDVLVRIAGTRVPNHNTMQVGNELLYNDSNGGRLVALPLGGSGPERSAAIPGAPPFARGLALLDARTAVVGSQMPLAVYQIDLDEMRVESTIRLEGEPTETVHAVCALPDAVDDPPQTLG